MTDGSFRIARRGLLAGFGTLLLQSPRAFAQSAGSRKSLVLHATPRLRMLESGSGQIAVPGLGPRDGGAVPVFAADDEVAIDFRNGLEVPAVLTFRGVDGNPAAEPLTGRSPIAPGASDRFTISFDRPGTLVCDVRLLGDGATPRAACGLIVREQKPLQVDRDEVLLIEDWRLAADGSLAKVGSSAGDAEPLHTINGQRRPTIVARPHERIRFRFINGCQRDVAAIKVQTHDVRVMAIDSCPAEPFLARDGQLLLAPGSRVDAIVDAGPAANSTSEIFLHDGRKARQIATLAVSGPPLRDSPLDAPAALTPIGLPERIDLRNAIRTEIALGPADQSGPQSAWIKPAEFDAGRSPAFRVPRGRAAVIALHNRGGVPVTFALHGHHFRLLDRLDDGWKPFWLDTLVIGPRQTHRIAFLGQHPGTWLMEAMAADWSAPRHVASYQIT